MPRYPQAKVLRESEFDAVRIVAIETTERVATLAAFDAEKLLHAAELNPHQRSAQSLAPGLRELLRQVGWRPDEVQLVATPLGPGSFTGLRLGVTTAKTFAYAVGAEVLGVNTLEAIAQRAPAEVQTLAVALDAQRQQVFAGRFARDATGSLAWQSDTEIVDEARWLERLAPPLAVSGPALRKLRERLPSGVADVDEALWAPTAAAVGMLAWRQYQAGRRDDIWRFAPHYYRASAAEEKWRRQGR